MPSRIDENDGILRHLQIDGLWSTLSAFGLLPSVPSVVDPKVPPPTPQTWFPHHAEVDVFFSFELMTFEPNIYFV